MTVATIDQHLAWGIADIGRATLTGDGALLVPRTTVYRLHGERWVMTCPAGSTVITHRGTVDALNARLCDLVDQVACSRSCEHECAQLPGCPLDRTGR